MAIMAIVTISAPLRPKRSAYAPMTSPPTGRITKPTPKVAKLLSSDTTGLAEGKKVWPTKIAKNP